MERKLTAAEYAAAFDPVRYAVVEEKNKREIVMLRGRGCAWRRCRFCDYHLDSSPDENANFALNRETLGQVRGIYGKLEVINSGSFVDLDDGTMALIEETCLKKNICQVHFECHWMHREAIAPLRQRFGQQNIEVKVKIGVETFDALFRESYLMKGIDVDSPEEIASYFDEVCLLQGLPGQTKEGMGRDIETGLHFFERVCVNIMQENCRPIKPDPAVIDIFSRELYPIYIEDDRVDILMENTAFGVGGVVGHE